MLEEIKSCTRVGAVFKRRFINDRSHRLCHMEGDSDSTNESWPEKRSVRLLCGTRSRLFGVINYSQLVILGLASRYLVTAAADSLTISKFAPKAY